MEIVIGVVARLYKIKKMAEEFKFLREQINEKKIIIRSLFSLKLPTVKRTIFFIKLGKILMAKIYLTVVKDEIPECKCVNGPIKDDIALHKNKL